MGKKCNKRKDQAGLEVMDCGRAQSQGEIEVERIYRCCGPMCHVVRREQLVTKFNLGLF